MSLLKSFYEPCVSLIAVVSGAPSVRWAKGASFSAAILFGNRGLLSMEREEPDHLRCSVTVGAETELRYGELFLRLRDGMVYRVLSDPGEAQTPPTSSLRLRQYRAERIGAAQEYLEEAR